MVFHHHRISGFSGVQLLYSLGVVLLLLHPDLTPRTAPRPTTYQHWLNVAGEFQGGGSGGGGQIERGVGGTVLSLPGSPSKISNTRVRR